MNKKQLKILLTKIIEVCHRHNWDYMNAIRSLGTLGGG